MSWKIGDLCVAKSKQFGWTNSEIKQINKDVANVEFIEYGDSEEVNISDLKLFGPFAVNKKGVLVEGSNDDGGYAGWKVGDACVAQWTHDGAWYNSQILHFFNEDEILVRFVDYGNADFATLGNLKPAGSPLENAVPSKNDSKTEVGQSTMKLTSVADNLESIKKSENTARPWSFGDKCGNGDKPEESDEIKTFWKVGDLCVAMWNEDNIWYNSQIIQIKGDRVLVRFTDYGNEDYTTLDQLKPFVSLDGASKDQECYTVKNTLSKNERDNEWKVGDLCVARWDEDQVWYESEIIEIDGENVLVRFVEYGNEDYTTLGQLKPAGSLLCNAESMDEGKMWEVGDLCVARWEEDLIWYNSKIIEIHGEKALVQFVDYGNEDFARLSELKPAGTLEMQDVNQEKGTNHKHTGAIPKVKKGDTSKIKKGSVPKVKLSASQEQLPTSEKRAATEEESSAAMRNDISTPEDRAKQLLNMFPYFSPDFLLDKARKYGTIEHAVDELLNDVQMQELFKVKEAPEDIAEQLKNMFPDLSPEFLLDKAREYGTIEIAINELLNYVQDQDLLKQYKDESENGCVKERVAKSLLLLNEQEMFKKVTLTEKRDYNPDDPLDNKFRLAKGHYLSVSGHFASPIESIDYVENRILLEIFERKRSQFKSEGKDTKEYFLFHGTDDVNVESILRENFQMDYAGKHGLAHGRGIYFSEKTAIPDRYMKGTKKSLLLCRVLLGREFCGVASDIPEGFDSKSVRPDEDKRADINVIKEVDQILPCFVLNLAGDHLDMDSSWSSGWRVRGVPRQSDVTRLMSFQRSLNRPQYSSATLTNVTQVGANSATSSNTAQVGASSGTPTNVAQVGASSATSSNAAQVGASSGTPTNLAQVGASSGTHTNVAQVKTIATSSRGRMIQNLRARLRQSRASSATTTNVPQNGASSAATTNVPQSGASSAATTNVPQNGASSSTPTNVPQSGASSAATTNVPQSGTSSSTPTNVPQSGASSAASTNVPQSGASSAASTNVPQSGASSSTPTNVPQSGASSADSSDSDPALGEASSYMARRGFVTCPYDASHIVHRDMIQAHVTLMH